MVANGLYYHLSLARVAAQKAWPRQGGRLGSGAIRLAPIAAPSLPSGWVSVRPLMTGICGSDIALLRGQSSPYLAPLTSFPAVLGHEILAEIPATGQRVVVDPSLSCQARRLPPCQMCSQGRPDDCLRRVDPGLGAGLLLGYNARMPGGWSEEMWAPAEQLVSVPDSMPDERAVLTEPAAIVLTGLKELEWGAVGNALVIGSGTLGLLAMALVSELYPAVDVFAMARYPAQRSLAAKMGAGHIVANPATDRDFLAVVGGPWKTMVGYPPHYPRGFDVVVVTAGSAGALADGMRWVSPGGHLLLLGGTGVAKMDWTPVWSRRVAIHGSYGYGESGADTFRAVLSLFSVMSQPLEELVTHRFRLSQHQEAIRQVVGHGAVGKAVFTP